MTPTRLLIAVAVAGAVTAGCNTVPEAKPPGVLRGDVAVGEDLIDAFGCGTCHVIPGVDRANGEVGPPLTDFGERRFIAGTLPNNQQNLIAWIVDPQAVEPGTAMPDLGVTPEQAAHISAYLLSLD